MAIRHSALGQPLPKRKISFGYSTAVAMEQFFAEQRKQEKAQRQADELKSRQESLQLLTEMFERDFGPLFPAIFQVVKTTLFKQWERQNNNKQIPQARQQIENCIREIGNTDVDDALAEFEKFFKRFRLIESIAKSDNANA